MHSSPIQVLNWVFCCLVVRSGCETSYEAITAGKCLCAFMTAYMTFNGLSSFSSVVYVSRGSFGKRSTKPSVRVLLIMFFQQLCSE